MTVRESEERVCHDECTRRNIDCVLAEGQKQDVGLERQLRNTKPKMICCGTRCYSTTIGKALRGPNLQLSNVAPGRYDVDKAGTPRTEKSSLGLTRPQR